MRLQVVKDGKGKNTGVFITIEDWDLIKINYPDIDNLDEDIPQWQKQFLDRRLEIISKTPGSIKAIDELFTELDSDI